MSMINDALRRASDAAKTAGNSPTTLPPASVPPPPPPLPGAYAPVAEIPASALAALQAGLPAVPEPEILSDPDYKSPRTRILISLLLVLGIGVAAGVSVWKKKRAANLAQMALDAAKANKTVVVVKPPPSPTPAPTSSNPPAPVEMAPVAVMKPLVPAEPVKFPPLRLQSIFYRPSNPSVMINGKTLFVTDEIQGVIIADIRPASVTLVLSGQTNILTLR